MNRHPHEAPFSDRRDPRYGPDLPVFGPERLVARRPPREPRHPSGPLRYEKASPLQERDLPGDLQTLSHDRHRPLRQVRQGNALLTLGWVPRAH